MAGIYDGISTKGRYFENWQEPFYFSGTLTQADEGKAVVIDATAAKTVKLATNDAPIIGRLEVVENRIQEGLKVCTVALKFVGWLPYKTGETFTVGDSVVGAGAGEVKEAAAYEKGNNVVAIDATNKRVLVIYQ